LAAVEAGKTIALANKETLVAAGPRVMRAARERGATILPVDSEHSAVFQAAQCGRNSEIRRVILTASGGPFRDYSLEELRHVTRQQALEHPTWEMGPKVTIDSATMMNKALEIIEARWLFDLDASQISVVVHPQSIVHSMVEFVDGSVIAQMSPPDMRLPIQYAMTYPGRRPAPCPRIDWNAAINLQFYPPDPQRFPAVELGLKVARDGGTCGAVINAANEAAVAAYLANELSFVDIVPACAQVLGQHHYQSDPTLDEILRIDRWAREEINKWICA
jgi:1-deoxy-D-xylulose-5-phosphate reductoisomerase